MKEMVQSHCYELHTNDKTVEALGVILCLLIVAALS